MNKYSKNNGEMMTPKIPPPIVTAVFGSLMFCVSLVLPIQVDIPFIWLFVGIFAGLSILLLFPAVLLFFQNKTTVNPLKPESATVLVKGGIYRYTRNPMYLGMAVLLLAWVVYLSNPLNLVLWFSFFLYMNQFQIKPEEQALLVLFGEEYSLYKNEVRRWL